VEIYSHNNGFELIELVSVMWPTPKNTL